MALPAVRNQKSGRDASDSASAVWLRISAFLSMRSPNTQETYLGIVKEWCQFLGGTPGTERAAKLITNASDIQAIAYRQWLQNRPGEAPRMKKAASASREVVIVRHSSKAKKDGLENTLSNATIAKKFAALRRIYRMLIGANLGVDQNPFDSDKVPAPPKDAGRKRPTEMLDFKLVKKVVDSPGTKTPKAVRDRAILAILFGGGLRRSEVVNLRIGDVRKTSSGTLFLYLRSTKAKKDAQQALPTWAAQAVQDWAKVRRSQKASDGDYLFISYTGQAGNTPIEKPVSASGIYKLFTYYCRLSGAGKFITPHSARATAITKLLADGIPHRKVQEFSRHSSIQMVEAYDKRRIGIDESPAKDLDYD